MKTVIHIEPLAPRKPPEGEPCNGCGVCCLTEPCPVGVVLSGRRVGRCRVLRWDAAQRLYRCGVVEAVSGGTGRRSGWPARLRAGAFALAGRAARRWIGAGRGCDCSLEVEPATAAGLGD